MGWLFTQGQTRAELIEHLTKPYVTEGYETLHLKHCLRGNVLWAVVQVTYDEGKIDRFIACYLLKPHKGYGWGHKDMCERDYPYYYTCPLSYLDEVPVACEEWREKVRREAARKSAKFEVGDVIELWRGCTPAALRVLSKRPFRAVSRHGTTFKMTRSRMSGRVFPNWEAYDEAIRGEAPAAQT